VTFSTSGHAAGDTYLLAAQVPSDVTASGLYPWQLYIRMYSDSYLSPPGDSYLSPVKG
jgi:hypothetical protein